MPQVHRPCSRVQIFHQRLPRVRGWNRSAANTPIWHQTELSTRLMVLAAEKGMFSFSGWVAHSSGRTDLIVKYIANRPAKNMSSLASHTMVPTWTMLGRLTPTCCCGVSAKEAVATGAIIALPAAPRPGGRSARAAGRRDGRGRAVDTIPQERFRTPVPAQTQPCRRPLDDFSITSRSPLDHDGDAH